MALSLSTLTSELTTWLSNKNLYATPMDAAQAFASAYKTYCEDGQDGSGDLVISATLQESSCASTLAPALSVPGIAATAAAGYAAACGAMWTGTAFSTAIIHPALISEISSVITAPPVGSIAAALTAIFLVVSPAETDASKAAQIAAAIHAGTLTGAGVITGPSVIFPFPVIQVPFTIT